MALLQTGDRICSSCGGTNGRHQPACSGGESVEVISAYTAYVLEHISGYMWRCKLCGQCSSKAAFDG